jgi:hypothetical protein
VFVYDIIYIFAGVLNTFYSRLGKINLRANLNILARNWRVSQKLREKNVWENLILHTQTQKSNTQSCDMLLQNWISTQFIVNSILFQNFIQIMKISENINV